MNPAIVNSRFGHHIGKAAALLFGAAAHAGTIGVSVTAVDMSNGYVLADGSVAAGTTAAVGGAFVAFDTKWDVYRLWVMVDSDLSTVGGVGGSVDNIINFVLDAGDGGVFYNHPTFDSDTPQNPAVFAAFPTAAFDTFITIGRAQAPIDLLLTEPNGEFSGFQETIICQNCGWTITPAAGFGVYPNPTGHSSHRILIGQFTVTKGSTFSGRARTVGGMQDFTHLFSSLGLVESSVTLEAPQSVSTAGSGIAMVVGEFDAGTGDNADPAPRDLASLIPGDTANSSLGEFQIFIDQGLDSGGTWLGYEARPAITTDINPRDITIGRFNSDPWDDIAITHDNQTGVVEVFLNDADGTGAFTLADTIGPFDLPRTVVALDVDDDGLDDLAVASRGEQVMTIHMNNGQQSTRTTMFTLLQTIPDIISPLDTGAADLDNDGDIDLVVSRSIPSDPVTILENTGRDTKMFVPIADPRVGNDPVDLAFADVDGNSFTDIITADAGAGGVTILLNDGDFLFRQQRAPTGGHPRSVDVGHFDDDGDVDIVVAASEHIVVLSSLFEESGAVGFTLPDHFVPGNLSVVRAIAAVDVDQDGWPDVVATGTAAEGQTVGAAGGALVTLRNTTVESCLPDCAALPCFADCAPPDGNGTVNIDDVIAVVQAISTQDLECDIAPQPGDGTVGDGLVDLDDLLLVIDEFGPCPL